MSWTLIILFVVATYGLLIGMLVMICVTGKRADPPREKEPANYIGKAVFHHLSGMPFAERAAITIYFLEDRIAIHGEGQTISLVWDDVLDIVVQPWEEMQEFVQKQNGKQPGKKDFRLKEKGALRQTAKKKSDLPYFMIIYRKEGKIDFASFQAIGSASKAVKMVQIFRKRRHWKPAPIR
ncbi:MAG: hypothetical protein PHT34_05015 [Oscillospiraceae bacterium]|nr:hypothetical protein [Oscillospiraceae bacterium]